MSLLATWMFRCRTRTQTGLPFDSVMSVLAKISSFYHTRDDPDRALSLRMAMGIAESMLYERVRTTFSVESTERQRSPSRVRAAEGFLFPTLTVRLSIWGLQRRRNRSSCDGLCSDRTLFVTW